ncbi:unnamed protein product [Spirodela intermedia]|uniref:CUE domain-containing protein n=1 Tax=Spirodela intermedia TaxID=51605 RepID=A0A7I8KK37_SPIIN|nr:unnamed protein product [Spirodela intermedia]
MSAGICGKRLGIEEIFGSSSAASSAKRSRCSRIGSPVRSFDRGFGPDEKVSTLLRMFPSMDQEVVETVLNSHDHKIDDAIKSLHSLCLGDASVLKEAQRQIAASVQKDHLVEDLVNIETFEPRIEDVQNKNSSDLEPGLPQDGFSWVDFFVQEMMKASNWDDVRVRVTKILESFEKQIINHSRVPDQLVTTSLREQLQCLLRDNQILKRAVAIQRERNLELEEKSKEIQHLKHVIRQYQEQVRALEMSNYTLKIHLQRAQDASSIPNNFNPDIF